MINRALNKPALQSSTSVWSQSRTPAEDACGANNGATSPEMGFHTSRENNPWWQVDLEAPFMIDRVTIYNRRHMAERLRFFSVLLSMDGARWVSVFTKRDASIFGSADDEPYVVDLLGGRPARFVRIRLNGYEPLHFNELQAFGEPIQAKDHDRVLTEEHRLEREQAAIPVGRTGHVVEIGGFALFADTANYDPEIIAALENGGYEAPERGLLPHLLRPGQRVIEVGTAAGLVTLTAAAVVGASNVVTFEANPDILADARENFHRNDFGAIDARFGVLQNIRAYRDHQTLDFGIARQFWSSRLGARADDPRIVSFIKVPTFCLEREILAHAADVLICDIEGGEADLLAEADLPGITLILMETHYRYAGRARIDDMIRSLVMRGFAIDLSMSAHEMVVLRRSTCSSSAA